jgi:acyl-CoA thioesterase
VLTATAIEDHVSNKLAIYRVTVKNQDEKVVALFKGTVYRMEKEWEV